MTSRPVSTAVAVLLAVLPVACGGGGGSVRTTAPAPISVTISGQTGTLNVNASRTFTATVVNSTNTAVAWSVVEQGGGTITQAGTYTAPAAPATYTVKAVAAADPSASATVSIPVVIPVGHIAGFDVGVDYHAVTNDFVNSTFIKNYNQPAVRQAVRTQLQGMADRGATVISTRIWFVTEPGGTDFGEAWRATFPITDQEQANLRSYAQDVATVMGSGGNRLRLDICLLWLGAADYTRGTLAGGLGFTPVAPAEFTRRFELTTDKVLASVSDVKRPDGVTLVDTLYMDGEVMIGTDVTPAAKPNQDWFMTTHYPRFVQRVSQAGLRPAVYFNAAAPQSILFDNAYTDATYPILNNHRSMFWVYRTMKFMVDNGLPLPSRIDFSVYVADPAGAPFQQVVTRVFADADATLPSLGAPRLYGAAETHYFVDPVMRRQLGQAFATEAGRNPHLQRVCFWTAGGSDPSVNPVYPYTIEDFYPPPN